MPPKPKYGKKIVKKIVELVKADNYTISEICTQVGIVQSTYHKWREDYPEFAEAIEQAKDERMQMYVQEAKKSLLKKIRGYEVTETKVVTVPSKGAKGEDGQPKPIIKEQHTSKKHVAPDTAAIIFTLTNGDPEHWKNRQHNEVTGKDGRDLFSRKTDEELEREIQELKRKLGEE